MWPFRTQPEALKPAARARLERVVRDAPKLEAASHRREDLTDRCARDDTKAGAQRAIRVWCTRVRASGRAEFERCLGTLERWMEAITHAFQGRQTSGFVEGFNNRVKGLKRRCDGIFTVGSLFPRLPLDWHGYQLFGHP